MFFLPEVSDRELPRILDAFVGITGPDEWTRCIDRMGQRLAQNEFLRAYLNQTYSLELEFERLLFEIAGSGQGNQPIDSVERYRLFAFMTTTVMVFERLNPLGKNRLKGMILGGLRDHGLTPLQQEMAVVAHLLGGGFDVSFSDMENGSGFDFLAKKEEIEIEVECKRVGPSLGRKVPCLETLQLHKRLYLQVEPTFVKLECGLFLRVVLPGRLNANESQQTTIAAAVGSAIRTGVTCQTKHCRVEVHAFDVSGTPFERASGEAADMPELRVYIEARYNIENREMLILGTKGTKRALVISVESELRDTVLRSLFSDLSKSVERQFSLTRPGILCVQFMDMTNEQILRIESASDDPKEPKRPSQLWIKTSDFLQSTKRSHILSVAFRGHGIVERKSAQYGEILTTAMQEQGNAFYVSNGNHPLVHDRRYSIFAPEGAAQSSRVLL